MLYANSCITCSRFSLLEICFMFRLLTELMSSVRKFLSSLLFLMIVYFLVWMCFSKITILTVSRVWSDISLYSEWIIWLSNSDEVSQRNIRSMTKFELFWLFKHLVGTWFIYLEIHKLKESAISVRILQWLKWWGNKRSQLLSLILKSSVMTRTLLMFASVFLKYFKAVWDEFKYMLIKKSGTTVKEEDTRNISIIKNVFLQRKSKMWKSNIYI